MPYVNELTLSPEKLPVKMMIGLPDSFKLKGVQPEHNSYDAGCQALAPTSICLGGWQGACWGLCAYIGMPAGRPGVVWMADLAHGLKSGEPALL